MPLLIALAIFLTAIISVLVALSLRYPTRCYATRDRPDLPGPTGLPLIGDMLLISRHRNAMLRFLDTMEKIYGPLFTFTLPCWGRNIVINRPEWLEHMRKGCN